MDKAKLMAEHRALFGDNKFRSIDKKYYEWKIYKNPVAKGDICLEVRDGRVVGSSALIPRKVGLLNEIFMASEGADSFTLPEYRRQGINSKVLKSCYEYAISHGMYLIYGAPNEANYRLHIKLGFLPCPFASYNFMTKSLTPIFFKIKLILKILLSKDRKNSYKYLKYLFKRTVSSNKNAHSYEKNHKNKFHVTKIDYFNEKVNPLWGEPRYSFFILRDKNYLNWRYFENPDEFTVLAAQKDEEYLGYIALKLSKDNTTGFICDFVTLNDVLDVFVALVKESEKILKRSGAKIVKVRCIVDSQYCRTLDKLGYYDYGEENYQSILIYSKTDIGKRLLDTPGKWHFTLGDSDEV